MRHPSLRRPFSRRTSARYISQIRAFQPGHELALLSGGGMLFPALIQAIAQARTEVLLETYIFDFTGAVLSVVQALEQAAQRGVRVCVMVDGVGTGDIPAAWQQRLQAAGVQWQVFSPARGLRLLLPKRWRRLHRKLCVVDGRVGFCGGINLLDDYFDPHYGQLTQPRFDFAVRVSGPLVADMQAAMLSLWTRSPLHTNITKQVAATALRGMLRHAQAGVVKARSKLNANVRSGGENFWQSGRTSKLQANATANATTKAAIKAITKDGLAALVLRDNLRFRYSIETHYLQAIARAQHEIVIANAYFIPGVKLQRALLHAAKRGVRVTLLLQGKYEYFMQYHASRAVYDVMLRAGVQIIEYDASFLHAKVAVVDGQTQQRRRGIKSTALATVGSSNLDPLSLLLAREANVFIRDPAFVAQLRDHLVTAMAQGHLVLPHVHTQRPWLTRSLNWVAYALMRVLLLVSGKRY
jgi:cardiolipin synthase A/B